MRIEPPAGLGGDVDRLARPFALQLGDQPLTAPVAVDVRRVDEVDARVDGLMQHGHRLFVVYLTPTAADRPRAKAHIGHLHAGSSRDR